MIMKHLDVHGLMLYQAKRVIKIALITAYQQGVSVLNINHGFNNGRRIKYWCKRYLPEHELVIKVDSGENEGISKVFIKTNFMKG